MEWSLHEKEKKHPRAIPCYPDLIILLYPPSGELWPAHARSEVPRFDVQHPATSKRAHPEIHWRISGWYFLRHLRHEKNMNRLHPWSLTWFTWKSTPGKGNSLLEISIFRFHVKLWRRASKSSLCVSVSWSFDLNTRWYQSPQIMSGGQNACSDRGVSWLYHVSLFHPFPLLEGLTCMTRNMLKTWKMTWNCSLVIL